MAPSAEYPFFRYCRRARVDANLFYARELSAGVIIESKVKGKQTLLLGTHATSLYGTRVPLTVAIACDDILIFLYFDAIVC